MENTDLLLHLEGDIGFAIAKVKEEIPDYESFIEIISKDKRVRTTVDPLSQVWYSQGENENFPNKLGIAKNYPTFYPRKSAKFYEFAFQAKDKDNKTIIAGLHKTNRPMAGFGFDYTYWNDKFFIITLGVDVTEENLENTVDNFFKSTGLTQDTFSNKMSEEFEEVKISIIKSIYDLHDRFNFDTFKKVFCYEL